MQYLLPSLIKIFSDYEIDVAGKFWAAQYVYDLEKSNGIYFPTKRRAYKLEAKGNAIFIELMVSIDITDIQVI
jgi:hypothetical protein